MHGPNSVEVATHNGSSRQFTTFHRLTTWDSPAIFNNEGVRRFIIALTANGTSTTLTMTPEGTSGFRTSFDWSPPSDRSRIFDLVFVGLHSGDDIVDLSDGDPTSSYPGDGQNNATARWVVDSPAFCSPVESCKVSVQ